MRFEWLFLGYLLLFQLTVGKISLLPVAGFSIMLFAMFRLSKFEAAFVKAKYVLFAAVPIGAALLGLQLYSTALGDTAAPVWYDYVYNTVRILCECAEVCTMFFVYLGVREMGKNADFPALVKHSTRNMAVMAVYFIFEMTMSALSIFVPQIFKGYEMIFLYPFIVGIIWRILNLWMIITCYLGIARDNGDTESAKDKKESDKQEDKNTKNKNKKKKSKKKKHRHK